MSISVKWSIFIFYMLFCFLNTAQAGDTFKDAVLKKAEEYQQRGELYVGQRRIYAIQFFQGLYRSNEYRPLWNKENRESLFNNLSSLDKDGLTPNDYLFPEINHYLEKRSLSATEKLDMEILLTEALTRAIYNLAFGKVDAVSLDPNINFTQKISGEDKSSLLLKHLKNDDVSGLFTRMRPSNPWHHALQEGLEKYRGIKKAGGWPRIPDGAALKPGMRDSRVNVLRQRLVATGDLDANSQSDPMLFDESVKQAVESYQSRHGLGVDGAVGKETLESLNVPVQQRIDQIRVNLERHRWYMHLLKDEYLLADIARYQLYWIKQNEIFWQEKIQVGKAYTKTPIFKKNMTYLEFNPTWTIPPGIKRRSILPKLKKDPQYLDKKGYLLLTHEGKQLDPASIDWQSLKSIPYIVRQPPGPDNALGLVKFMFPNSHYVYIHDTNHREHFDRTQRMFSSGCIRLNNPFDLAEKLLAGQQEWDREKIEQLIKTQRTTRVNLEQPMPIIIAYSTAFARDAEVQFKRDIYKRDAAVLKALDGDFKLRRQDSE